MSLTLYFHPLASFCHKVLIALYENGTEFQGEIVDLGNSAARAAHLDVWPVGKIPVLRDERLGRTVPETTIIIEHLDRHYPGARPLLPKDETLRLDARLWDRFFDNYVQGPMQRIVADRLRPDGERDARGVAEARAALAVAYGALERHLEDKAWPAAGAFTLADCAAAPALFYAGIVAPFAASHPRTAAYFERLLERPAFKRVLAEARPWFEFFPYRDAMPARFLTGPTAS
jgi:glutathione S-transferase